MIVIGIDAHMRSHTVVAVDAGTGRQLDELTVQADEAGHRRLLEFAARLSDEREWAIEDCRNLSRHLEAALLRAGERVRRVPPKLMSGARKSARTFGKSDPIDALAVARAALREPDLPVAQLAGPEREIALVLDHRANLIVERTRLQSRLRWLLYELDPTIELAGRSLDNMQILERLKRRLAKQPPSVLLRICRELLARIRELTVQVRALAARPATAGSPATRRRCSPSRVSARSTPPGCWPKSPTSAASAPRRSSRSTPASPRWTPHQAASNDTASTAPATASSTPPCT